MSRRLPTYTDKRLDAAISLTREATGWQSRDLIADAAAEYLTYGSGVAVALADARRQVMAAMTEGGA